MKLYKLTTADGRTRLGEQNECQWGENITHRGTGKGGLCGPGFIHAYTDPLLAVMFNPIHADYSNPQLWECEGDVALSDRGTKVGCVSLTTVRRIQLPQVTTEQRVRFGILCALQVYTKPEFVDWAHAWLDGNDRAAAAAVVEARAAAAEAAWLPAMAYKAIRG